MSHLLLSVTFSISDMGWKKCEDSELETICDSIHEKIDDATAKINIDFPGLGINVRDNQ